MEKDNKLLSFLNIFSVVASIFLPIVFLLKSIHYIYIMVDTISKVIIILFYLILTAIGYWGNIIQGLRAIANGRCGTLRSTSIFQLIMYIPHMIMAICIKSKINPHRDGEHKFYMIILIFLAIICILAVLKLFLMKNDSRKIAVATNSKEISKKILLFCIAIPLTIIAAVLLFAWLVFKFPIIQTIITVIGAILFMGVVIFFAKIILNIFCYFNDGGYSESYSNSSYDSPNHSTATYQNTASNEWNIIDEMNNTYYKEFKRITGESPDLLDYKIIPQGPKKDAVTNLRNSMIREAKAKNVYGKTKYF